jgi:GNAT superfamily N-acetyltransferase
MADPSGIEFRVATPADALCVGVLAMQVFLDTYAREGVRPDLAREALASYSPAVFDARIRDAANHFLLAERAGHLVAFSECSRTPQAPVASLAGGVELVRLYVQGPAQRAGIGEALLVRAEAHAMGLGAPWLWLTAWSGNTNARAFYLAQGYSDVGAASHVFEGNSYENRVYAKAFETAKQPL